MTSGEPYNNADHAVVEARRWRAVTLANRGLTHRMIAEQLADEYRRNNPSLNLVQITNQVGVDIYRALREYRKRTDQTLEQRITAQELRFAEIRRRLYGILASKHYVLNKGEIVHGPPGPDGTTQPLQDSGPILAALAQLRALEDQEAKLHGTYSSDKITVALERRVEDDTALTVEAILAAFNALPELDAATRQRALEAAGAHLRAIDGEVVDEYEDPE